MKYSAIFLLFVIISESFAYGSTFSSLAQVSQSKFGKTLLDAMLVELKTGSRLDPRPKIAQLLSEIQSETEQAIKALDAGITVTRGNCKDAKDHLQSVIGKLQKQVEDDSEERDALAGKIASSELSRSTKQELVNNQIKERDALTSARKTAQAIYEDRDKNLRKVLYVLETTQDMIKKRSEERLNAPAPSFLQTDSMAELKQLVSNGDLFKISGAWTKIISFLTTKAFNAMRQNPDTQAAEGFGEILKVFDNIIRSVNKDISDNNALNQADIDNYNLNKDRLDTDITLGQADIGAWSTQIATDGGSKKALEDSIATNNDLINTKNGELNTKSASCDAAEVDYNKNLNQRNTELNTIHEVTRILNDDLSNLREYAENAITSSQ